MENMILRNSFVVVAITFAFSASAQFGITAGPTIVKSLGSPKALLGFHIGGELSQDDASSYFGRVSFMPGSAEVGLNEIALTGNTSTAPYATTTFTTKTNFTRIEGGVRYYLGDGYETGLSAYGGSKLVVAFNKIKADYTPYDEVLYRLPDGAATFGTVFGFGFGLQGGVKYGIIGLGTIYFDAGLDYLFTQNASNGMWQFSSYLNQPLFSFNLGFRKDLFIGR